MATTKAALARPNRPLGGRTRRLEREPYCAAVARSFKRTERSFCHNARSLGSLHEDQHAHDDQYERPPLMEQRPDSRHPAEIRQQKSDADEDQDQSGRARSELHGILWVSCHIPLVDKLEHDAKPKAILATLSSRAPEKRSTKIPRSAAVRCACARTRASHALPPPIRRIHSPTHACRYRSSNARRNRAGRAESRDAARR